MANDNYNSSPFTPQYTLIQKIKELQDHVKTIYENEEQFNQRIAELESKSIKFITLENVDLTADSSVEIDFSAADFGKASGVKNCKLFIICSHGPVEYGARPVIFELSKFKQDLSLNEITFNGNVFSVSSDDKYVDTISAVATFSLGKIRIKFARVSLNFDLETIPHIFEIGSSTDVTSVFDKIKVGDMINQGDERLYICVLIAEDYCYFFVIDTNNDKLGYWIYLNEDNNWIFNEEDSFDIDKSSVGGTKLYKHNIEASKTGVSCQFEIISTVSTVVRSTDSFYQLLISALKIKEISAEELICIFNDTDKNFIVIGLSNALLASGVEYDEFTNFSDSVTKL